VSADLMYWLPLVSTVPRRNHEEATSKKKTSSTRNHRDYMKRAYLIKHHSESHHEAAS
jgi:hypothetical protein